MCERGEWNGRVEDGFSSQRLTWQWREFKDCFAAKRSHISLFIRRLECASKYNFFASLVVFPGKEKSFIPREKRMISQRGGIGKRQNAAGNYSEAP